MGKFLVRITVIITSIYLAICFYLAQFAGIDILDDWYSILFEAIVVVYSYSEGRYHCKHMKHLTLAIFIADTISRLDNSFDFLTVSEHNLIPVAILALGMSASVFSALHHFYRVNKVKQNREKLWKQQTTK